MTTHPTIERTELFVEAVTTKNSIEKPTHILHTLLLICAIAWCFVVLLWLGLPEILFLLTDMINMMKIDYEPGCCEWIYRSGDAVSALAW